tara:strand:+ start:40 stop:570 length:531 start_codon:yes stop_codon:yes gene_type:complete
MKAILGNFTKISETEFRLKKDLQFADISVDESHKIQSVNYNDKQDIKIGDILTHNDSDYEIKLINTQHIKYTSVEVELVEQPYVEPPKPKFIARKMSPPKPRPKSIPLKIIQPIQEEVPISVIEEEHLITNVTPADIIPETIPVISNTTPIIPKKISIFKKFTSYLGNKLTSYSDS